jgi:hypothetical protein
MMPKNNLLKSQYTRLYVFADADHPFEANIMKDYEAMSKVNLIDSSTSSTTNLQHAAKKP